MIYAIALKVVASNFQMSVAFAGRISGTTYPVKKLINKVSAGLDTLHG